MKFDIKSILNNILDYLKRMFSELYKVYSERGIEPFKKPLIFSVPAFLISYFLIYSPSVIQLNNLKRELKSLETLAPYYNDYASSKQVINSYIGKLPLYKDKDEWLNYIITSTSRKIGISIESLSSQQENEVLGFSIVSRDVTVTTTYDLIGKWIAEIENSPIYVKITNFNLKKVEGKPGFVSVSFKVTTVVPKPEAG